MNPMPLIQCNDAIAHIDGFHYEGEPLNLNAFAGEMISIIGPDYSGKSAWLKMICGMETAESGSNVIMGKSLSSYNREDWINLRKNIAFIDADTALLSAANGLQNVMMPALYHATDTAKNILRDAQQLLEDITPDANTNVLPAFLQKDQRYKIAIARSLILKPKAIVIDSPFDLLDALSTKQLKDFLIRYSKDNNVLIIIITHDVQFALTQSNKVIFASKNHIEIFDNSSDIRSSENTNIRNFLKLNLIT